VTEKIPAQKKIASIFSQEHKYKQLSSPAPLLLLPSFLELPLILETQTLPYRAFV